MSGTLSTPTPEPEWAALAAIDWADQKHFWRLLPADTPEPEQGELDNTPEAVEAWAVNLERRFGGRPIALCIEQSRGALVYMLGKYPHLVLFPVHPTTAARYRETFTPSGAKSDASDTASLLDLLLRHRERLRPLRPDTPQTRLLQFLVEERRRLVDEKTRQNLRLQACLKMYFPQILQWFGDVTSPLVADLLRRWGDLEQLQHAHSGTLRKFFHQHNCRGAQRIEDRIQAIYPAIAATKDPAVVEAGTRIARGLVALLETLRSQIASLEQRIDELVAAHADAPIFASLPGCGKVLTPRMIVALGTCRDRYQNSGEVQCSSGIAPVKEGSGKTEWIHFRFTCPTFVRQTFHEFAGHSIGHSLWAKAYYEHLRHDEKKDHHAAVRSLAFKWIRIIYRCWKDGKPYDEELYLQSLRRRGSPLAEAACVTTNLEWKTVGGFQKISRKKSLTE